MDFENMSTRQIGEWGEGIAASFLERQGFEVLDRNWRTSSGEVDIVAKQEDEYVLVEVKTARSSLGAFPEVAVDDAKQARYGRLAQEYLAKLGKESLLRFDIISISVIDDEKAHLRHISNAFSIDS